MLYREADVASSLKSPTRFIVRESNGYLIGTVLILFAELCINFLPHLIQETIDTLRVLPWQHGETSHVTPILLLAILLLVFQTIIRFIGKLLLQTAGTRAVHRLRKEVFQRICYFNRSFFAGHPPGEVLSYLTNDISSIYAFYAYSLPAAINGCFSAVIIIGSMIYIDFWLTCVMAAPCVIAIITLLIYTRRIQSLSIHTQVALSKLTESAEEEIVGITDLKRQCMEVFRNRRYSQLLQLLYSREIKVASITSLGTLIVVSGVTFALALLLFVGGQKLLRNELTMGQFTAMSLYANMLWYPIFISAQVAPMWRSAIAIWSRIISLFKQPQESIVVIPAEQSAPIVTQDPPSIELRNFQIRIEHRLIIEQTNLKIQPGTICGIIGSVGTGKSLLAAAMARLWPVSSETLFYSDIPAERFPPEQLWSLISYVPQEAYMFSGTIRENIAFAIAHLSDRERNTRVDEAVYLSGLAHELGSFRDGLDTVIAHGGSSLSGGQRQRVALARALAAKRPILIFDDALSALDLETETLVLKRLQKSLQDTTVVLITHRSTPLKLTTVVYEIKNQKLHYLPQADVTQRYFIKDILAPTRSPFSST